MRHKERLFIVYAQPRRGRITWAAEEQEEAQRFEVAGYPALRTQCDCIFGEDYLFRYDPATIQSGTERYSFSYYENKTTLSTKSYAAEFEKMFRSIQLQERKTEKASTYGDIVFTYPRAYALDNFMVTGASRAISALQFDRYFAHRRAQRIFIAHTRHFVLYYLHIYIKR